MRLEETPKQNEFNNIHEDYEQVCVIEANSNRRRDVDNNLQLVKNKRGRAGVHSPTRKGNLTLAYDNSPTKQVIDRDRKGLHLSKNKKGTSRIHSPKRDGKLTLASRTDLSPRRREVNREQKHHDDNKEKNKIVSSMSSPKSKRKMESSVSNDSNNKKSEIILYCPNNYDDDISSISDAFVHSIARMRGGLGNNRRGQDFAFSTEGRSRTIGDVAEVHERGQADHTSFGLECRSNTGGNFGRMLEVLSGEDDCAIVPREKQERGGDNHDECESDDDDDNNMIALPSGLQQRHTAKKSKRKPFLRDSVCVPSISSTRGQDETIDMPEPQYLLRT